MTAIPKGTMPSKVHFTKKGNCDSRNVIYRMIMAKDEFKPSTGAT